MPLDGIMLGALAHELRCELTGGKIDKIQQPGPEQLLLAVRAGGSTKKILLDAGCGYPRVHLTQQRYDNPEIAPAFCMLLRKHLTGGRLESIVQPANERMLVFNIMSADEMGDVTNKQLIIELMGKYSNIILANKDGFVLDAIKRVGADVSRLRTVMPHDIYELPPSQGKLDPFSAQGKQFFINAEGQDELFGGLTGVCRQSAAEMEALKRQLGAAAAYEQYIGRAACGRYAPQLMQEGKGDILPFEYVTAGAQLPFDSCSKLLESFYYERATADAVRARTADMRAVISTALERARRKSGVLTQKLRDCADMDKFRIYGELLTANLYGIKRDSESATVQNYYDENCASITIPLDRRFSPAQNAQRYYKQYRKLCSAARLVGGQIQENKQETDYLASLLQELDNCRTAADLDEVRAELEAAGYVKAPAGKPRRQQASKPLSFIAKDGTEILVGKNNRQNDELTLHTARRGEKWLHVKEASGSHVIIRSQSPSNEVLELAALLAAWFSSSRASANVNVECAPVENVKKPRGAKPGMVIYTGNTTYCVTPGKSSINALCLQADAL